MMGKGTVSKNQRAGGLTWIYRFQTTRASDGKAVENTRVIGMVQDIGSSVAARGKRSGVSVSISTSTWIVVTSPPSRNSPSIFGNTN